MKLLSDSFEGLEDAQTSSELHAAMGKFTKQMGFEHFTYALTVSAPSLKRQQYLTGSPPEWVRRYLAQEYFKVDPLIRHAEKSSLPILWDEHLFQEDDAQEFREDAKSFGLESGLSFAVHEQPGVTGVFSLSRNKAIDLMDEELAALIGRTQIFTSLLHNAISRVDLAKLLPKSTVVLTARERECLKWAADGKTAWEIGQILAIAERTVVFHLNNVMQKLGASNKTQAIVRAVAFRLL